MRHYLPQCKRSLVFEAVNTNTSFYITCCLGYMDRDLFKSWFSRILIPFCGNKRPVLLLMDNHDSHVSYDIMNLAKDNQV